MARRRLSFRLRLVIVLVIVTLGVYLGPGVVGRYAADWVTARAVPELADRLRVARWTLAWNRAVELEEVELLDDSGKVVLQIERISTDYALAHWLGRPTRLGNIRLESPELSIVFDDEGCNLARVLEPLLERPAGPSAQQIQLEVTDGQVSIRNTRTGRTARCRAVQAKLRWDQQTSESKSPAALELSGKWLPDDSESSARAWSLEAKGTARSKAPTLDALTWNVRIDRLPLALVESALPWELDLGGQIIGALRWDGQLLSCEDLNWRSPAGRVALTGRLTPALWRSAENWLEYEGPLSATWEVRLDRLWPRIRRWFGDAPGDIESGRLAGEFTWRVEENTPLVSGRLHADDVRTRVGQDRHDWNMPLDVSWTIAMPNRRIEVRRVSAQAPFMDATGSGTVEQGRLEATIDLARFQQLLGSAVLPRGVAIGGQADVNGSWEQTETGLSGSLQWVGLRVHIALGPERELLEERLEGTLSWLSRNRENGVTDLRSAHCRLRSGSDTLVASLRQATTWRGRATQWPLQLHLEGDLRGWARRLRPWISPAASDPQLPQGTFHADATVVVTADSLEVAQASASGQELRWTPRGIQWHEPVWRLTAEDAQWQFDRGIRAGRIIVQSTSVAASLIECQWTTPPDPSAVTGKALVRGDLRKLQRLAAVWGGSSMPADVSGELVANLWASKEQGGRPEWKAKWTARSLRVDTRRKEATRPAFAAPELRGVARVSSDETGALRISEFQAELPEALSVSMTGLCHLDRPNRPFRLKGTVKYDWESLRPYLPASWKVRARGQAEQPIQWEGTLPQEGSWVDALRRDWLARTTVSWEALEVGDLQIGPATTRVGYQRGMLTCDRIDTTVGTGRLTLRPWLDWRGEPAHLRFDPPAAVTGVKLTPEVCRGWLQYAIPLLADATTAEGEFSVETQRFDWPIGEARKASMEGTLQVEQARIGASPQVRQMLAALDIAAKLNGRGGVDPNRQRRLEVPRQTVNWKMVEGRIHHQPLKMRMGRLELTSQGSVGLDETIDVVLAVKIPEDWLAGRPLLASLRGQTLVFPLRGTLKNPKMSSDALKVISERMMQGAADELLKSGLNRLFGN